MDFGQKKFHEIDLFDFMSFLGLNFFKFSGPLWSYITNIQVSCSFFTFSGKPKEMMFIPQNYMGHSHLAQIGEIWGHYI